MSPYREKTYHKKGLVECLKVPQYHKKKDQWNRTEDPDMNPHSCTHLIFDKGTKILEWRKDTFFNKCCRENWLSAVKYTELVTMYKYQLKTLI
jgi:hypothetical protein